MRSTRSQQSVSSCARTSTLDRPFDRCFMLTVRSKGAERLAVLAIACLCSWFSFILFVFGISVVRRRFTGRSGRSAVRRCLFCVGACWPTECAFFSEVVGTLRMWDSCLNVRFLCGRQGCPVVLALSGGSLTRTSDRPLAYCWC